MVKQNEKPNQRNHWSSLFHFSSPSHPTQIMTVFQPKEEDSLIYIIQSTTFFGHISCSSFFPLPLPDRLFKSPLPYTSLKLRLASLSFAPRCRTRSKLQKNISFKTNRPLWNNLARKAENLNQADKKWRQETYPFAINLLHEKDILWAKSLFLSFWPQFKTAWLLVSMYEQYVFV